MAARLQLPGMQWFRWLRIRSLRIGIVTGIYLSCVFIAWLIVANRIPALYPFAGARNAVAGAMMLILLAIPVLRFRHDPGSLFVAGLTAWTVLTTWRIWRPNYISRCCKAAWALFICLHWARFPTAFVAVLDWVFLMCAGVRHQHRIHCGEDPAPLSARNHPQ